MPSPTSISFVRHGLVHNPRDVFYGRLARFHLSEEGRRHAQAVASSLKDEQLGAIFCSPLLRTSQTARAILAAHPGLVLHPSRLLIEVHSPYDGQPNQKLRDSGWDVYSGVPAGYEQPEDVLGRTLKFVKKIRRQYAGQHVVAVTHGDVIAFMILWAHGVPVNQKNKQDLRPYGVTDQYPVPGSMTTLTFMTDDPHELPGTEYRGSS